MIRLLLAALCSVAALPALAAPRCESDALALSARIDNAGATARPVDTGDDRKITRAGSDAGELIVETRDDGRTTIRYYSSGDTLRYVRSFGTVQQGKRVVAHTARLSWKADGSRCDGARYIRGKTARLDASAYAAFLSDWRSLRTGEVASRPVKSQPPTRPVAAPVRNAVPAFTAPDAAATMRSGLLPEYNRK
ncbi:hypothetical protein [Jeongeupia sp. USM3]|uniref:hypothetical protein n=1 Tax=Jeongeupia sp. USM3 TaxID=1906741 RepID=UPI00089E08AB|nr:hypothetical protein [Jeongeupia sp. USM3]AOY01346.1 hypothetical protein BJP62_13335 [Jeongeupia sp. USM3]